MEKEINFAKLSYAQQVKAKKELVYSLYPQHKLSAFIEAECPYYYRHKVIASFGFNKQKEIVLGQYQKGTHQISNGDGFLLQNETANNILKSIIKLVRKMKISPYNEDNGSGYLRHVYLRVAYASKKVMVVFVVGKKVLPGCKELVKKLVASHTEIETIILNYNFRQTSVVLGDKYNVVYGEGYLIDELLNCQFRLSPQSFYQVNPQQTQKLYLKALALAQLKKSDIVLDACCGIGTISLLASKHVKQVVGVEINENAIKDAKHNAKINNVKNASFVCCDIADLIYTKNCLFDVVFLDPPRQGCQKTFLKYLIALNAKKIIYISCNPLTQSRDISLLHKGGYKIEEIVAVDMFPNTEHVETIVLMSRVKG